jgi:hypothetical protein
MIGIIKKNRYYPYQPVTVSGNIPPSPLGVYGPKDFFPARYMKQEGLQVQTGLIQPQYRDLRYTLGRKGKKPFEKLVTFDDRASLKAELTLDEKLLNLGYTAEEVDQMFDEEKRQSIVKKSKVLAGELKIPLLNNTTFSETEATLINEAPTRVERAKAIKIMLERIAAVNLDLDNVKINDLFSLYNQFVSEGSMGEDDNGIYINIRKPPGLRVRGPKSLEMQRTSVILGQNPEQLEEIIKETSILQGAEYYTTATGNEVLEKKLSDMRRVEGIPTTRTIYTPSSLGGPREVVVMEDVESMPPPDRLDDTSLINTAESLGVVSNGGLIFPSAPPPIKSMRAGETKSSRLQREQEYRLIMENYAYKRALYNEIERRRELEAVASEVKLEPTEEELEEEVTRSRIPTSWGPPLDVPEGFEFNPVTPPVRARPYSIQDMPEPDLQFEFEPARGEEVPVESIRLSKKQLKKTRKAAKTEEREPKKHDPLQGLYKPKVKKGK